MRVQKERAQLSIRSSLFFSNDQTLPLTVIAVCQNGDFGRREVGAQLAPHGHAEADVKALLFLVKGVIDDNDATGFFALILIEAQHAGVVLGPGDVVRVGKDCAGYGAGGCS